MKTYRITIDGQQYKVRSDKDPEAVKEYLFEQHRERNRDAAVEEFEQAERERAVAQRRLEGSDDSFGENLLEGAGELAAGFNQMAIDGIDLVTSPSRAFINNIAAPVMEGLGLETQRMNSMADLFPDEYRPGEGGFMEEAEAAQVVRGVGEATAFTGGLAPVQRANSATSFIADVLGMGSSAPQAGMDIVTDMWDVAQRAGDFTAYDKYATGISDALSRRVSPQVGARVQRADEAALRANEKAVAEFLTPAEKSIELADNDRYFKGMLLDFAQGERSIDDVVGYASEKLGMGHGKALRRYLNWSAGKNGQYNKMAGDSKLSGKDYLHTQVRDGEKLAGKQEEAARNLNIVDFSDDQLARDKGMMERTRSIFTDRTTGSVNGNVDAYENPLLSNARRLQHNERLLQMGEKFGVKEANSSSEWLNNLEKALSERGIDEAGARLTRNSVVGLMKGQNAAANEWLRGLQSLGYLGTLAGPKSALLNLHDIPVAVVNNGLGSLRGMLRSNNSSLQRLGINQQTMGEFVQQFSNTLTRKPTAGQQFADGAAKAAQFGMRGTGFRVADSLGKKGVLSSVAQQATDLAKRGGLRERWGNYFDMEELDKLGAALRRTDGNVEKMNAYESELYDELVTAGLGQQQLISAAGRPLAWLDNPNARPLFMMRGFAIKQQAMLMRNVVGELQKGNAKKAAEYASRYVMYGGGGYAVLNQLRQDIFSDDSQFQGYGFTTGLGSGTVGQDGTTRFGVGQDDIATPAESMIWAASNAAFDAANATDAAVNDQYNAATNLISGAGNPGAASGLSAQQQAMMGLGGQQAAGLSASQAAMQAAMGDTSVREQDIYNRVMAMQQPGLDRQAAAMENRQFAQGRSGVGGSQYGGNAEQAAVARAQAEAQNAASFQAMGQAQQEIMNQGQLSNIFGQQGMQASGMLGQLGMNSANIGSQQMQDQLAQGVQLGNMGNQNALLSLQQANNYGNLISQAGNVGNQAFANSFLPLETQIRASQAAAQNAAMAQTGQLTGAGYEAQLGLGGLQALINANTAAGQTAAGILGPAYTAAGSAASGLVRDIASGVDGIPEWLEGILGVLGGSGD